MFCLSVCLFVVLLHPPDEPITFWSSSKHCPYVYPYVFHFSSISIINNRLNDSFSKQSLNVESIFFCTIASFLFVRQRRYVHVRTQEINNLPSIHLSIGLRICFCIYPFRINLLDFGIDPNRIKVTARSNVKVRCLKWTSLIVKRSSDSYKREESNWRVV